MYMLNPFCAEVVHRYTLYPNNILISCFDQIIQFVRCLFIINICFYFKLEFTLVIPAWNEWEVLMRALNDCKFCETQWPWPPLFSPNWLIQWSMGEGVLYNLIFTEWRHCVSQNKFTVVLAILPDQLGDERVMYCFYVGSTLGQLRRR